MFTRIRQRDNLNSGSISCTCSANAFSYQTLSTGVLPVVSGEIQLVQDNIDKRPFRSRYDKQEVPPLRQVVMSKCTFNAPEKPKPCTYKHVGRDYTWKFYGNSLAAIMLSGRASTAFNPPPNSYNLQTVQVDSNVASYLLQRAYSKMSSAEYDFGVSVGEVAETASMLAGPLRGVVKLSSLAFAGCSGIYRDGTKVAVRIAKNATAKQLRRLKATTMQHPINSSLRVVDESANHWLAYKFGVCPFLDDIDKAITFAKENVDPHFGLRVARVKGWKSDDTISEIGQSAFYTQAYDSLNFKYLAVRRTEDRHYLGLYWRNKINAPIVNFLETIGLSPFQLPSLAYELIPLSFVVDRFIDIKSFVRGNIGSLSKDTFGNYCTRKKRIAYAYNTYDIRVNSVSWPPAKVSQDFQSSAIVEMMARSVNTQRPNFPVVNPYWQEQLTADATNLSLIWGRLRTFVGKL